MASSSQYHHGDLHSTLIDAASSRLEKFGIDGLSLRKLAEDVGVSRTAPYHHFKDKNALLSAIAAKGFEQWHQIAVDIFDNDSIPPEQRLKDFIHAYIGFATEHPQIYELMFGQTLWGEGKASAALRDVAYPSFQYQVKMTKLLQEKKLLPTNQQALRLAQVTWGTLHGIARLIIDGIYADASHIEEMCDCAAALFMQQKNLN
ncbi:TetR/AcrR family transcriptional regulator [Alteromonas sp. ASW11-130]|uniref:TetR/AcrR family transcriptional regulator n=1 Tax=Alteromonas sp. ASW11-130 TaxID=3015775 RepID=UPI0022423A6E|nr:TetR/AcrR family transcriptional regulator [Alteromonas sp. ASW11-130]MCW8092567.1 TetR/AcrR family transcriptional regulator [Alteromonas sp. ASW11-130]